MRMSWKLGRIAGIDVFLHPTFLLILIPGVAPGLSPLLIIALFGCVVLHELGHALMARRFGIETRDITLYPIGGVARLERMPRAPGAELMIALAGPAVNFAIVAGLMGLDFLGIGGMDSDTSLSPFLSSLMLLNLVLGLFNLIPAFPMDGGRVLRAAALGLDWPGAGDLDRGHDWPCSCRRIRRATVLLISTSSRWLLPPSSTSWPAPRSRACWPKSAGVPSTTRRKTRESGQHRPAITGCIKATASGNWPPLS